MTCNCSAQSGGKKQRKKHKGGFLGIEKLFNLTDDQSQTSSSGYYTPDVVSSQSQTYGYNQPSSNYISKLTENVKNVGKTLKNKLSTTYSKVSGSNSGLGLSNSYMSGGRKSHRKNYKSKGSHRGGKKSRKNKSTRKHRKHRKH